jgi:signal transduction histidine kinase
MGIQASIAIYTADGKLLGKAHSGDKPVEDQYLQFSHRAPSGRERPDSYENQIRTENGFDISETRFREEYRLILVQPVRKVSSPVIFYVFSYQIAALFLGLGLIILIVRWLLRPYRRMVEAARESPIRASAAMSESEFVVETFQALFEQLKENEKELARLHALERLRAEKSERFSEKLVANIPSGLATIDSSHLVNSANHQTMIIFSANSETNPEMNNLEHGEFHTPGVDFHEFFRSAPAMVKMIEECFTSGTTFRREEVEVLRVEGDIRHLGLSISPITDLSHSVEGVLCLMTDITEVTELRERMKLQENLANLGEMAAGLAHEFKNSLATIQGYVHLLDPQTGTLDPGKRLRTREGILTEIQLLARLVTDFLNFARPQQLNLAPLDLGSIIDDSAIEIRDMLGKEGIRLRIKGKFSMIVGDETMLRRAFSNLLRNSIEAIDPDADVKEIIISGSIDAGIGSRYTHIRIEDTGCGVAPEDLARIFIPFYTTKSRGYGIGLAIVQKIFVAHGGDVSVEKSDPDGTVFHCRLPLLSSGNTGKLTS